MALMGEKEGKDAQTQCFKIKMALKLKAGSKWNHILPKKHCTVFTVG